MGKFLRPGKKSLQNPQHYEFINAFLTTLALAAAATTMVAARLRLPTLMLASAAVTIRAAATTMVVARPRLPTRTQALEEIKK